MATKKSNTNKDKAKIIVPTESDIDKVLCRTPKQAYKIFRDIINFESYKLLSQEHFWVMGIDAGGYMSTVYIAALGTENRVMIDPIDVFDLAVAKQSKEIILAHSHTGTKKKDLVPSKADLDFTNKYYHACLPFHLDIIDHMIIGTNGYYSFKEKGDMDRIKESLEYKPYNMIKDVIDMKERLAVDKAHLKGLEEGIQKGINAGQLEGVRYEKMNVVKIMLEKKYPLEQIMEITELNEGEIKGIKNYFDNNPQEKI